MGWHQDTGGLPDDSNPWRAPEGGIVTLGPLSLFLAKPCGHLWVGRPGTPPACPICATPDLGTALKQRTLPIIIENEELVRPFERYQRTQYWWPAGAITASLIMRSFPEIEFKRTEWDVHRTVERKIVLKPRG